MTDISEYGEIIVARRFTGNIFIHLVILLVLALALEVFAGNIRYWISLGYKEITPEVTYVDDEQTVVLTGFDAKVENIFIEPFEGVERPTNRTYVDISYDGTTIDNVLIIQGIPASKYINVSSGREISEIRIRFDNALDLYDWGQIKLNTVRPFCFEWGRVLISLLIGAAIVFVIDKRDLFKSALDINNRWQLITVIVVAAVTFALWAAIILNSYYSDQLFMDMYINKYVEGEYTWLVRGLLDGKAYMPYDPPSFMKELADPYDIDQINAAIKSHGESVLMDHAYFNGHYYCYYGIVPALLFHLPWYMITGTALPNNLVILVVSAFYIIASLYFVYALIRRYFSNVTFGRYLLLAVMFINCSGFLHFVRNPNIYAVPFSCSYLFMILGFALWMDSFDGEGNVRLGKLILGSLSVALTLGCRPTFYISLLFAFVIFAKEIKGGLFFRKKSIKNTLAVIVPFVIADLPLCIYNFVRFGSPFDFGASYNITVWNQHGSSFSLSRLYPGLYTYLIRPFTFTSGYPFISSTEGGTGTDVVYSEPFIAGFFFMVPVAVIIFALPWVFKRLKANGSLLFAIASLVSAVILLVIDIEFAGISIRYMSDFSVFIMIALLFVILSLPDNRYMTASLVTLTVLSIFLGYLTMLTGGIWFAYENSKPMIFFYIKYILLCLR